MRLLFFRLHRKAKKAVFSSVQRKYSSSNKPIQLLYSLTSYLLPSRLYCRYWNFTSSTFATTTTTRLHVYLIAFVITQVRGLYHRSGISPCPEDFYFIYKLIISNFFWIDYPLELAICFSLLTSNAVNSRHSLGCKFPKSKKP